MNKSICISYLYEISVLEDRKRFYEEIREKEIAKKKELQKDRDNVNNSEFVEKQFTENADLKEVPDGGYKGLRGFLFSLLCPIIWMFNPVVLFSVAICMLIIAGIVCLISAAYFDYDLTYKSALIWSCVVSYVIATISCVVINKEFTEEREKIIVENTKKEQKIQEKKRKFEAEQEHNRKWFLSDKEKSLAYINSKLRVCENNISLIDKELTPIVKLLDDYYRVGILYPTYQNANAVLAILQYLQSKRCDKLEGPDGAYDTYEKEKRIDTVIEQLKITNSLMTQLVKHTESVVIGINRLNAGINGVVSRLDRIQYSLLEQQELISRYNESVNANTDAVYQISSNIDAMKSVNQMQLIQQQQSNALLDYQNFAIKQQRLNNGHWS